MKKIVYTIQDGDLQLRFDNKKQAEDFYNNNKKDYMDAPEEIEIKTDVDLEDFYENGIHPYENKVDAECAKADGLEL